MSFLIFRGKFIEVYSLRSEEELVLRSNFPWLIKTPFDDQLSQLDSTQEFERLEKIWYDRDLYGKFPPSSYSTENELLTEIRITGDIYNH